MCVDEVPGRGGVRATLSCRIANETSLERHEQRERAGLTSHPSFAVLRSPKNRRAGVRTSTLLSSWAAVPEQSSRTRPLIAGMWRQWRAQGVREEERQKPR